MSEKVYDLWLEKVCRNIEEDWYPSFTLRDNFGGKKDEFHFRLLPASEADVAAWGQYVDSSETSAMGFQQAGMGPLTVFVKVRTEGRLWLIRKMFRPSAHCKDIWDWKAGKEGETDPLLKWPTEMLAEMFTVARRKLWESSNLLPETAPVAAEAAAPKS